MPIYTIRTTSGREDVVIDMLESNVKVNSLEIKSIFHPAEIKGYIFVEGNLGAVQKGMHGLMHAKSLIEKPVRLDEIRHFLEQKKATIRTSEGDRVEIIGGPFKGERGEVKRVDKVKDEVTIELLEASIPIPVTIATEFIKIIKKAKSEEIPENEIREPEIVAEPETEEKESEGFELRALKEREEARAEKQKEAEKQKFYFEEPKKTEMPEKPAEKPSQPEKEYEEEEGDEVKGGILEELEREELEKKKKRLKDKEYLEDE